MEPKNIHCLSQGKLLVTLQVKSWVSLELLLCFGTSLLSFQWFHLTCESCPYYPAPDATLRKGCCLLHYDYLGWMDLYMVLLGSSWNRNLTLKLYLDSCCSHTPRALVKKNIQTKTSRTNQTKTQAQDDALGSWHKAMLT